MTQHQPNTLRLLAAVVIGSFMTVSCQKDLDTQIMNDGAETALASKAALKEVDHAKLYEKEVQAIMQDMMQQMNKMEMTCDPDVDFAHMMIMHHEAGIRMSEALIAHGHSAEAEMMAMEAIENDEESIARLEAFLAAHTTAEPLSKEECKEFMMEMKHAMHTMMQCMRQVHSTDADILWASQMICHHQGALDMSQIELKYGDDDAALEEARMIIEEQSMHIMELAEFINEHVVHSGK